MARPYSTLLHVFVAGCVAIVAQMALCALLMAARFPLAAWIFLCGLAAALIGWRKRPVRALV